MRKKFSSPVGEENIFLTCWRLQLHSCAVILCSTSGKILYSIENSISISSPPAFFILYCTFTKAHPSVHCQASLMMDFFALLWSKDRHFRRNKVLKSDGDTMLTAEALGWQFQKGVDRFCATNIGGDTVRHSLQCTCSFSHLMSVHDCSPFLGANFVCKPPLLLYGGALVNAWPDFHVSCHRWLLITLIFTFHFQEHIWTCSSIWFQTFVWKFPYSTLEDWVPKIIEKRWRLFTPDFLSNM